MKKQKGALLLEVLIAVTVLSVGILSCLNIFSAAIFTANRSFEKESSQILLDQAMFEMFLDPSSVNLEEGDHLIPTDAKTPFEARLKVDTLQSKPEEEEAKDKEAAGQKPVPKILPQNLPVEFYDLVFKTSRKGGKRQPYVHEEILFRYGQKKSKT